MCASALPHNSTRPSWSTYVQEFRTIPQQSHRRHSYTWITMSYAQKQSTHHGMKAINGRGILFYFSNLKVDYPQQCDVNLWG
jgi:hypothetical protein